MDYLIRRMDNMSLQRHLLSPDTATVASAVLAIEEYLVVGNADSPTCWMGGEEGQLGQMVKALAAQSEVLTKMMIRFSSREQSKEIATVQQYSQS